ncbi:ATP-binding protein [Nostoc sp. 'Lobaria pulmonaria (5183) cyanobiont']|uniref:ATP-binding protein n=1 Tax=Nostoc sp. 'Lobaria pulmonaria (5183) cyanobiont' TaxID=1618022 RepID=UPI000CF35231|nr:ATP-binding protein [Nostoc sp. 'Lobaria pulmonaria (5183) cyanobiont']
MKNQDEGKYYIDFSSVCGGQIIEELKEIITFLSPDEPTCNLFTGHIGCGKSTELLRLQAELEQEGFHVVYFESSNNMEMENVDIADILLAIASSVSESLQPFKIEQPKRLQALLKEAERRLHTEVGLGAFQSRLPIFAYFRTTSLFTLLSGIVVAYIRSVASLGTGTCF